MLLLISISGGPRGGVVKDANLYRSESLVISQLWVRAQLRSCETSQALLANGQVVFLRDWPAMIDFDQNERIDLDRP